MLGASAEAADVCKLLVLARTGSIIGNGVVFGEQGRGFRVWIGCLGGLDVGDNLFWHKSNSGQMYRLFVHTGLLMAVLPCTDVRRLSLLIQRSFGLFFKDFIVFCLPFSSSSSLLAFGSMFC